MNEFLYIIYKVHVHCFVGHELFQGLDVVIYHWTVTVHRHTQCFLDQLFPAFIRYNNNDSL